MINNIKYFKVSSAGWEFIVDSPTYRDAALSGLIMAFSKYDKNLLLSTTIMIEEIEKSTKKVSFIGTHDMLFELGLTDMAKTFFQISNISKHAIKGLK
jgi:hypothetical protein|tara:strand:- start:1328 stop:1621 length:294 start_codon:yes stop_codon:yes gene_type:complete